MRKKDILCWIAAILFVLIGFASSIQIVDQVAGEGWNPILYSRLYLELGLYGRYTLGLG